MTKTWFITGASKGFGREWAEAALERGDKVAATARKLETLDALVDTYGDAVLPIQLDVTDRGADFDAVKRAAAAHLLRQAAARGRDQGLRVTPGDVERVAARLGRGLRGIASDSAHRRTLINLLMKLQLVDNFINHFSLCSEGETHQIQILSFDTAYGITIGSIMGGRKHLFCIESRLYSSCERAIKHPEKRDTISSINQHGLTNEPQIPIPGCVFVWFSNTFRVGCSNPACQEGCHIHFLP